MERKEFVVGAEKFVYTDVQFSMPKAATAQLVDTLEKWAKIVPYEPTFVMQKYGVPSLIVRFDGVLVDGTFKSYEIQGGCGWIGYASVANPAFKEMREKLRATWPRFKLLMPPVEHSDDELWLERTTLTDALQTTEPLMIRRWLFNEFDTSVRESLVARAMKPMFHQNDKRYGLEFGWWKHVVWEAGHDTLPWDRGFALKPTRGHGSTDVMLWNPHERRGRATRTQILDALKEHHVMYLQEFIPPSTLDIDGRPYNMMFRPFFGYDPDAKKWIPMHGVWTARPQPALRLHGASDAVSGPLLME